MKHYPVFEAARPFYASDAKKYFALEGDSLLDIVSTTPNLPPGFMEWGVVELVVFDKGKLIERAEFKPSQWKGIRPKLSGTKDVHVVLRAPLHGQGGGGQKKNPLMIVALVAIIALSFAVSAGAFNALIPGLAGSAFGTGATAVSWAKIAGAGIALIGTAALSFLSKPPALPTLNQPQTKQPNTAAIQGNTLSPNTQLPRVVGTKRIAPPAIIEPLIEDVEDNQYAECIFVAAGPHKFTDIRFDMIPASQVNGTQVITRRGLTVDPLFAGFKDVRDSTKTVQRYAHTDNPNISLSQHDYVFDDVSAQSAPSGNGYYYLAHHNLAVNPLDDCPHWHNFNLHIPCDETWITLAAPAGWSWSDQNDDRPLLIPFRIRMRIINANGSFGPWQHLPEFWYSRQRNAGFNFTVKLFWRAQTATEFNARPLPPEVGSKGFIYTFGTAPNISYLSQDCIDQEFSGWAADTNFCRFSSWDTSVDVYSAETHSRSAIKNVSAWPDRLDLFLDPANFPRGDYQVQITRGAEADGDSFVPTTYIYGHMAESWFGYHPTFHGVNSQATDGPFLIRNAFSAITNVSVTRIASVINSQPSPDRNVALIAVKTKNQNLGTVTALTSGLVPDWNGSKWTGLVPTSNPAPHCRYILNGSMNLDPVGAESLNDDDFVAFRTQCASQNYQVNGELNGLSVPDAFNLVAGCGFGFARFSEKYGVGYEHNSSAEGVTCVFTPFSSRQFSAAKAFPAMPDGLRVTFADKFNDYFDSSIFVYADGKGKSTNIQEIRYEGLVTSTAAKARALFDLRMARLRPTFYNINVPAQYVYCRKGDLIGVQHDVLLTKACFGRLVSKTVASLNITSITVDNPFSDAIGAITGISGVTNFLTTQFGVAIEDNTGSVTTHQATLGGSPEGTTINFVTPFADSSDFKAGNQVTGGSIGQEFIRLKVFSITPQDDDTADIVAVDEANGLFA